MNPTTSTKSSISFPVQNKNIETNNNFLCDEILLNIFSYLPKSDLYTLKLTCKRWAKVAVDNYLWEKFFKEKFNTFELTENNNNDWFKLYHDYQKLYTHPENLNFAKVNEFSCPNGLHYSDMHSHLLAINNEHSCKVWDLKTGECLIQVFNVHLRAPIIRDGKLYISTNKGIAIWDVKEKSCVILSSTLSFVSKMLLQGNILFCTDEKKDLEIWDVNTHQIITTLTLNDFGLKRSFSISDLDVENNVLSFFATDYPMRKLILWDLQGNSLIKSVDISKSCDRWSFKHNTLVTVNTESIEIFDVKTENKITFNKNENFKFHRFASKMQHSNATHVVHNTKHLATLEVKGLMKIWDVKDGTSEWLFSPWIHKFTILKIILSANLLFTASADGIKLWNIKKPNRKSEGSLCYYPLQFQYSRTGYYKYEYRDMHLFDNHLVVHLDNRIVVLQITKQTLPNASLSNYIAKPLIIISKEAKKLKDKLINKK